MFILKIFHRFSKNNIFFVTEPNRKSVRRELHLQGTARTGNGNYAKLGKRKRNEEWGKGKGKEEWGIGRGKRRRNRNWERGRGRRTGEKEKGKGEWGKGKG